MESNKTKEEMKDDMKEEVWCEVDGYSGACERVNRLFQETGKMLSFLPYKGFSGNENRCVQKGWYLPKALYAQSGPTAFNQVGVCNFNTQENTYFYAGRLSVTEGTRLS